MERCSPQQLGRFAPKDSTHNVTKELAPIPESRREHTTGRYTADLLRVSEIAAACELFSKQDAIKNR